MASPSSAAPSKSPRPINRSMLRARRAAVRSIAQVIESERSLEFSGHTAPWIKHMVYETLRFARALDALTDRLLSSRTASKVHPSVRILLWMGLLQLWRMDVPPSWVVLETVETSKSMKMYGASGLINAVLRRFVREEDLWKPELEKLGRTHLLPTWWLKRLQEQFPSHYDSILESFASIPDITFRVHTAACSREKLIEQWQARGIEAYPHPLAEQGLGVFHAEHFVDWPEFQKGLCSVQDAGAQIAVPLLDVQSGMRVLDACSAPGGKLAHLLQNHSDLQVTAVDHHAERMRYIQENLERIGCQAELVCCDLILWAKKQKPLSFDRILLDAPCSASGVFRRHPEIGFLRKESELDHYATRQYDMLEALWPLLKPKGKMLYSTCSLFQEENQDVISKFLEKHPGARHLPTEVPGGSPAPQGIYILPRRVPPNDGFFLALIQKT